MLTVVPIVMIVRSYVRFARPAAQISVLEELRRLMLLINRSADPCTLAEVDYVLDSALSSNLGLLGRLAAVGGRICLSWSD